MMEQHKIKLHELIKNNKVPNILFYGPYMCGKEILCQEMINMLYVDKSDIEKYVLKINCISTNGIKDIKEDIKLFSKQIFHIRKGISFKTIILMYAENLTYDSQYSLRRTIEQYNKRCRFFFVCENKFKLLNPICSRFAHFYVNNNTNKQIYNCLDKKNYSKITSILNKYHSKIEKNELQLYDIHWFAKSLYMNQYIALEVLDRFKKNENYNNVKLIFPSINEMFKNEVMSIFYILVIFRNNSKLQIYDYY